jgi:hypothetical protein
MITLPPPGNTRAEYRFADLNPEPALLLEAVLSVTIPPIALDALDRSQPVTIVRLVDDSDGPRFGVHAWQIDAHYPGPGSRSTQTVFPIAAQVVDLLNTPDHATPEAVLATVAGVS